MRSLYFYISAIILLLTSCKREDVELFKSSSDVYFRYTSIGTDGYSSIQYDTVFVSFALRRDSNVTITVPVNILGNISGSRRLYALATTGTAIAGKHYLLPPADSLYISSNTVADSIKLNILRPADLRDTVFTLMLDLNANDNFSTNMKVFNYAANPVLNATRLKVTIDDILPEPKNWAASVAYLGPYSRKKLELMAATQNLILQKFYYVTLYTAAQQNNFAKTMQIYLNAQKKAGNTVYEKNGTEMKMGLSAQ